jgi:hypothetical protein
MGEKGYVVLYVVCRRNYVVLKQHYIDLDGSGGCFI